MECFCDYEPAEFYAKSEPKARKERRCCECGKAIQVGQRYEYVRGKWDGEMSFFKTCCRCVALRDHLQAHAKCFCWAHGNLLSDIRGTVEELPIEAVGSGLLFELGRLAVAIKRAPPVTRIAP